MTILIFVSLIITCKDYRRGEIMVVILNRRCWLLTVAIGAMLAHTGTAECPNACSGHGDCDAYDMCKLFT